jgi:hypothetical protein
LEFKILSSTRRKIEIHVESCPPWKQSAADKIEKQRQKERAELLRKKAKEVYNKPLTLVTDISLKIKYKRNKGRSDPCNIIGGITDILEEVYMDDRFITNVSYFEENGTRDEYWIVIKGNFFDKVVKSGYVGEQ